jgi:hypothetical protein
MANTTTQAYLTRPHHRLLSDSEANTKLAKNLAPTWGLSLAQHNLSGYNVCPYATPGCIASCVGKCGMAGVFPKVMQARIAKTRLFFHDRPTFLGQLVKELRQKDARCERLGVVGVVRLNVFSDLPWENWIDLSAFKNLRFYDYTKNLGRAFAALADLRYSNYRLCYSVNEDSDMDDVRTLLARGGTAAIVLNVRYVNANNKGPMPDTIDNIRVIDGDVSDDRGLDPRGVYVGLRLKGRKSFRAEALATGFACNVRITIDRKQV